MRIFLDANILFSAAKSDGAVRRLVGLLLDRGHDLWINPYVLEEARRNLEAKAPEGLPVIERFLSRLHVGTLSAAQPATSKDIPLPEKDIPVLLAAVRCRCEVLITGDLTHFGPWYGKAIGGIRVCSPRSAFDEILKKATEE
jgi:predicted nucleic acid-binding protein